MAKERFEDVLERHRIEIDDYTQSVAGLYMFCKSAMWDHSNRVLRPGARHSVPRTMTPVDSEADPLTPDAVVQPVADRGVVAEMKKNFRPGDTENYDQLKKYDQELVGWWTEGRTIESHDLVLLTHYLSSTRAVDALQSWEASGSSFERPYAIVEFTHTDMAKPHFVLKRVAGQLSDEEHDEALREGKAMPEHVVVETLANRKFYDDRPPLIYTVQLIWMNVLPPLVPEEDYGDPSGSTPSVEVSAPKVRDILEQYFCAPQDAERTPKLPRLQWVKDALEALLSAGLAEATEGGYRVHVKKVRGDPVEFLTRKLLAPGASRRSHVPEGQQGDLFSSDEDHPEGEDDS